MSRRTIDNTIGAPCIDRCGRYPSVHVPSNCGDIHTGSHGSADSLIDAFGTLEGITHFWSKFVPKEIFQVYQRLGASGVLIVVSKVF